MAYTADDGVISRRIQQIEQCHSKLVEKRESLVRTDFVEHTTEKRTVERRLEG